MRIFVASILALVITSSAGAEENTQNGDPKAVTDTVVALKERIKELEARQPESLFSRTQNFHGKDAHRFQPYRANYGLFMPASKYDDDRINAQYSFRYSIFDCKRDNRHWKSGRCDRQDSYFGIFEPSIFLSYTGAFDFYMGSRPSGPVVNRMSNPAIHLYSKIKEQRFGIDYLELAFEHRSNGQVVEVEKIDVVTQAVFDAAAQTAFEDEKYAFFDTISRESNYFNLTFGTDGSDPSLAQPLTEGWVADYRFNWQVSLKAYTTQGNRVTWGPFASEDVDVDDYDLARISASRTFAWDQKYAFNKMTLSAEYTVGNRLFETDSFDVAVVFPYNGDAEQTKIPLVLKLHHGPMNNLSDYTKSVTSFGVGLALWY